MDVPTRGSWTALKIQARIWFIGTRQSRVHSMRGASWERRKSIVTDSLEDKWESGVGELPNDPQRNGSNGSNSVGSGGGQVACRQLIDQSIHSCVLRLFCASMPVSYHVSPNPHRLRSFGFFLFLFPGFPSPTISICQCHSFRRTKLVIQKQAGSQRRPAFAEGALLRQ